ncbi:hypothetical protein FOCC_FOCC014342 [Frankliniella occidentalis]|nr:hypothetical protein FOCC_FOCC014342 [Frankliniella occidentalis]
MQWGGAISSFRMRKMTMKHLNLRVTVKQASGWRVTRQAHRSTTSRRCRVDKENYELLKTLDDQDAVASMHPFECPVCLQDYQAGEGLVLKGCLHVFCRLVDANVQGLKQAGHPTRLHHFSEKDVIHEPEDCAGYQERIRQAAATDAEARATRDALDALLAAGEAMRCPGCTVVIMKRSGCDALVCAQCKLEICWATKQARWGPNEDVGAM